MRLRDGCVANTEIALVAAQAHSKKEDRAVVISCRNFIRAFGGAGGLAVASAIFANTLIKHLDDKVPKDLAQKLQGSIFTRPDISGLDEDQRNAVLDAYVAASKSVFYLWAGTIGCCLLLMVFVKDKGLRRTEETSQTEVVTLRENSRRR